MLKTNEIDMKFNKDGEINKKKTTLNQIDQIRYGENVSDHKKN